MIVFALSTTNKLGLGLIGLAVVVFALVASMLLPRRYPDFPGRHLRGFVLLSLLFFVAMLFAVFYFGRESHAGNEALGETGTTTIAEQPAPDTGVTATTATTAIETETTGAPGADDLAQGKEVFLANCGGCHALGDAGTSGSVGPDLDETTLDEAAIQQQVIQGGGAMPPFQGALTPEQIRAVSAYVAQTSGS